MICHRCAFGPPKILTLIDVVYQSVTCIVLVYKDNTFI